MPNCNVPKLRDAGADYFCVDVAHAHAKYVGKTLKNLRKMLADRCIMAGNVATYAGADYLASCGADIITAGIGGGSVCSTRIKTGFGVPMLTLYSRLRLIVLLLLMAGSKPSILISWHPGADFCDDWRHASRYLTNNTWSSLQKMMVPRSEALSLAWRLVKRKKPF